MVFTKDFGLIQFKLFRVLITATSVINCPIRLAISLFCQGSGISSHMKRSEIFSPRTTFMTVESKAWSLAVCLGSPSADLSLTSLIVWLSPHRLWLSRQSNNYLWVICLRFGSYDLNLVLGPFDVISQHLMLMGTGAKARAPLPNQTISNLNIDTSGLKRYGMAKAVIKELYRIDGGIKVSKLTSENHCLPILTVPHLGLLSRLFLLCGHLRTK